MKRVEKRLLVELGLGLSFLLLLRAACDATDFAPQSHPSISIGPNQGPSADLSPVTINTGKVTLDIPRNYLLGASTSGDDLLFIIVAILPDFRGVDDPASPEFHSKWHVFPDSPRVITAMNLSNIASAHRAWDEPYVHLIHEGDKPNFDYGLIKIRPPLPSDEYYVSAWRSGQKPIVIKCNRDYAESTKIGCSVEVDLVPGLVMRYGFDRSILQEWQRIHSGMMRLMLSFVRRR